MRLGVAIPLANEEKSIGTLIDRVLAHLSSEDRVFCVLDRVSRDQTRQILEAKSLEDRRIEVVWAPENRCVVDAYVRGYRAALSHGAKWILEMDGGMSHQPEDIPKFIQAMEEGYDFAAGCRFMPGGQFDGPFKRKFISKSGTVLSHVLLGAKMRDMTSGFECFTRQALESVLRRGIHSRAHFFQTEIKYHLQSWRWKEVPIHYKNPSNSVGRASLKDALSNLARLTREHWTAPMGQRSTLREAA